MNISINLAHPLQNDRFDQAYLERIHTSITARSIASEHFSDPVVPASQDEMKKIVMSLNRKKAPDKHGLTAEHLQFAGGLFITILTYIVNEILRLRVIPDMLKDGILTPVLKKDRDAKQPTNYRGITVTPILGKVIEKLILLRIEPILSPKQNCLQKGFTKGCSSNNASLLVSEVINEAKDGRRPVYMATLDVEKAFDVVAHDILFQKLDSRGINGDDWLLIKSIYTNATTEIKWNCELSNPIDQLQGVRQGGILSTTLYKVYNQSILDCLQRAQLGFKIGHLHLGSPTCADDIALLADNPSQLQAQANVVEFCAPRDRFKINGSKCDILIFNNKKSEVYK